MAKKKSPSKKKAHAKKVDAKLEPASEIIKEAVAPVLEVIHHDKKHMLLKGISIHLLVYVIIALVLSLFRVPPMFIFLVMMVLLWGLFMISYAFINKK